MADDLDMELAEFSRKRKQALKPVVDTTDVDAELAQFNQSRQRPPVAPPPTDDLDQELAQFTAQRKQQATPTTQLRTSQGLSATEPTKPSPLPPGGLFSPPPPVPTSGATPSVRDNLVSRQRFYRNMAIQAEKQYGKDSPQAKGYYNQWRKMRKMLADSSDLLVSEEEANLALPTAEASVLQGLYKGAVPSRVAPQVKVTDNKIEIDREKMERVKRAQELPVETTAEKVGTFGGELAGGLISFDAVAKGLQAVAGVKSIAGSRAMQGYTKMIEGVASKYPRLAPLIDMGIKNAIVFNTHGQLFVPPEATLKDRAKKLGWDTLAGTAFAGVGQMRQFIPPKAAMAIEPFALFGIGAGIMGEGDWQDRLLSGATIMGMHYMGMGLNKAQSRKRTEMGLQQVLGSEGKKVANAIDWNAIEKASATPPEPQGARVEAPKAGADLLASDVIAERQQKGIGVEDALGVKAEPLIPAEPKAPELLPSNVTPSAGRSKKTTDALMEEGRKSLPTQAEQVVAQETARQELPPSEPPPGTHEIRTVSRMADDITRKWHSDVETLRTTGGAYKENVATNEMHEKFKAMPESERLNFINDPKAEPIPKAVAQLAQINSLPEGPTRTQAIEAAIRTGSDSGVLLNAMKLIRTSTPEGLTSIVKRGLETEGLKLAPKGEAEIKNTSREWIKAKEEFENASREYEAAPSEQSLKRLDAATDRMSDASNAMEAKIQEYAPQRLSDTAFSIIQTGALQPISHVRNITGTLFKLGADAIPHTVDQIARMMQGRKFTMAQVNPWEWMKSFGKAVKNMPEMWRTNTNQATGVSTPFGEGKQRTIGTTGFDPLRVFTKGFEFSNLPRDIKTGRVPTSQIIGRVIERTLGIPAGVNAKALLIGDSVTGQIAKDIALKQVAVENDTTPEMVMANPKLRAQVTELTKASLFQQDNNATKYLEKISKILPANKKLLGVPANAWNKIARTAMGNLFIKTPANVAWWLTQYAVPELSLARGINAAMKGDRRMAVDAFGKAVMGTIFYALGEYLRQNELITGAIKDEKMAGATPQGMGRYRINTSGLWRALKREDPKWQPGDETKELLYLGPMGVVAAIMADTDQYKREEAQKSGLPYDPKKTPLFGLEGSILGSKDRFKSTMKAITLLDMMKGTQLVADAIKEGRTDQWMANVMNLTSNLAGAPTVIRAMKRVTEENRYSVDADADGERAWNAVKEAFGNMEGRRLKHDMWGQPVKTTPEGANPIWYQWFSITRGAKIKADPATLAVLRTYRDTNDKSAIPSVAGEEISDSTRRKMFGLAKNQNMTEAEMAEEFNRPEGGKTSLKDNFNGHRLTTAQADELDVIRGKIRHELIRKVVEDKNGQPRKEFFDLKPEVRLRVLRGKYELADRQALIQFIKKYKELDRPK